MFYLLNSATLSTSLITLINGKALNFGGAIYQTGTSSSPITLNGCKTDLLYFEANEKGGFLYADNTQGTFSTNCDYQNFYSKAGGFIYAN